MEIELRSLLLVVFGACLKNGTWDLDNEGRRVPRGVFSCRRKRLFLSLSFRHTHTRTSACLDMCTSCPVGFLNIGLHGGRYLFVKCGSPTSSNYNSRADRRQCKDPVCLLWMLLSLPRRPYIEHYTWVCFIFRIWSAFALFLFRFILFISFIATDQAFISSSHLLQLSLFLFIVTDYIFVSYLLSPISSVFHHDWYLFSYYNLTAYLLSSSYYHSVHILLFHSSSLSTCPFFSCYYLFNLFLLLIITDCVCYNFSHHHQ